MSDFLTAIAEASLLRARSTKAHPGAAQLRDRVAELPPPTPLNVSSSGFDVIAEAKLASPSEGALVSGDPGADQVVSLASSYESHGAVAVSVLTEPTRFAGSLDHLEATARKVSVPVLRKDFLVDPIQVLEARAAGASGVLLIARMLSGESLAEMTDLALGLGMFALVEVFDTSDLKRAVRVFDREVLVGVNCRDLATLEVDRGRFAELAPHLPDHLPAVAESGIATTDDVAAVARLGYRMALIGSSLVSDPGRAGRLERIIESGRNALTGADR